jgi:hypothetical protein
MLMLFRSWNAQLAFMLAEFLALIVMVGSFFTTWGQEHAPYTMGMMFLIFLDVEIRAFREIDLVPYWRDWA